MPFMAEGDDRGRSQQVVALPSAVLELTWVLNLLYWHNTLPDVAALEADAEDLRAELGACWPDGFGCLPDTSILAERIGALLTDECDTFLRGLERAAQLDGVGLELRSETPEVRAATIARLDRLRREPAEARRYAAFLSRVWELLRPEWESQGRGEAQRVCADWTWKLRRGTPPEELLPSKHLVHRGDQEPLLSTRPRIVLSPMHFATVGGFVIDMTSFLHLGGPARPMDDQEARRRESELIASRMKVLSDGTRVALLRDLAEEPASVMDLARRFGLAQPTVSNHVRMLRDAGLLESRKDGARVLYSAPADRLDRVLSDTRHLLLEH